MHTCMCTYMSMWMHKYSMCMPMFMVHVHIKKVRANACTRGVPLERE